MDKWQDWNGLKQRDEIKKEEEIIKYKYIGS